MPRRPRETPSRMLGAAVMCASLLVEGSVRADPAGQGLSRGQHFTVDPVADGLLIAGGAGFSGLLSLVLSTGEIKPTPPGDKNNLLSFDRWAVDQTIDSHAALYSDIGLYSAVGFAVLDPILSGVRDGWDAALVDAVMYAETLALTETITDMTKITVPRLRRNRSPALFLLRSRLDRRVDHGHGHVPRLRARTGHASAVDHARCRNRADGLREL